jgi:hypothetical protein
MSHNRDYVNLRALLAQLARTGGCIDVNFLLNRLCIIFYALSETATSAEVSDERFETTATFERLLKG